jgi:hypothetical protein
MLLLLCCSVTCVLQDAELQSNCCLTCFGLQAVNVQTAGQGGAIAPEVSAAFLRSPEKVREAIRLAVKLNKQQSEGFGAYRAPVSAWGAVAPAAKAGGNLAQRLQDMDGLVVRGVLTRAEADTLKVGLCCTALLHAKTGYRKYSILMQGRSNVGGAQQSS